MGNWILWTEDLAAGRTSVSPLQITASNQAAYAGRLVDVDQTTLWQPNSTGSGIWFSVDLGAAYDVVAFALGNLQNLSGTTLRFIDAASLGSTTGSYDEYTLGTGKNQLFAASNANNVRYMTVLVPGAMPSGAGIGSFSVLATKLEFARKAPRYDIGRDRELAYQVLEMSGGAEIAQKRPSTRELWTLVFPYVQTASGQLGADIETSLDDGDAWADGIWLTDDQWGASQGNAYYGRLLPGSLRRPIRTAGGRADYQVLFRTFSLGQSA